MIHTPVLLKESIDYLITDKSGVYADGTIGFGGHAEKFLEILNDDATLIGCDVDKTAFDFCKNKFQNDKRVRLYNYNFDKIDFVLKVEGEKKLTGAFADLGVSSFQLDNKEVGFTFREDAPLDLRMDKTKPINAADVLNSFEEEDLVKIFYDFGEEFNSKKIAKRIVEKRGTKKFTSTKDLYQVIEELTPPNFLRKSLSRVFQALRIYVNNELDVLKIFLNNATDVLDTGGRVVIISYHSLEDRIVKDFFKYQSLECVCPSEFPICVCGKERRLKVITKRIVTPSDEEVKINYRARSAKMRVAEKL